MNLRDTVRPAPPDRVPFLDNPSALFVAAICFWLALGLLGVVRYLVSEPDAATEVRP